jgi:hypothetical protein
MFSRSEGELSAKPSALLAKDIGLSWKKTYFSYDLFLASNYYASYSIIYLALALSLSLFTNSSGFFR